jgi:hypothetical protein
MSPTLEDDRDKDHFVALEGKKTSTTTVVLQEEDILHPGPNDVLMGVRYL